METAIGQDLDHAAKLLTKGQLVSIPTETVYGLGGNGLSEKAVLQIFEVKNRPKFDPLILHVDRLAKAEAFVSEIPDVVRKLAANFSPGPITYVLPKKSRVPDITTSGQSTVAVRIPDHPTTLDLLGKLDFPVAAPSANPFGYISPTTAQHVWDQLQSKIPYILDGGPCQVGVESTIVTISAGGTLKILRLGGLSIEAIQTVVPDVEVEKSTQDQPDAPGRLKSHYAPGIRLVIDNPQNYLESYQPNEIGIISFNKLVEGIPEANQRVLSPNGDLKEAAAHLFKAMRELDQGLYKIIVAERFPDEGLGRAINDRLEKAAAKKP